VLGRIGRWIKVKLAEFRGDRSIRRDNQAKITQERVEGELDDSPERRSADDQPPAWNQRLFF
jgi:hypothetical protein